MSRLHSRGKALFAGGAALLVSMMPSAPGRGDETGVVIISQKGRADFLKAIEAGAKKAASEADGQKLQLTFAAAIEAAGAGEQIAAMEKVTAGGIIIAPLDHDALAPAVAAALDKKISVVAIDSAITGAAIPQVACDWREEGRMAARELAEQMGRKGSAVLLRNQINSANTETREEGFQEIIRTQYPGIHLVCTDFHAGASVETAQRVSKTILDLHAGGVDGVFASSEVGTLGMLAALRQAGMNGKVKLIGVDEGDPTLPTALSKGDVRGLVMQDTIAMGYEAVKAIEATLAGRTAGSVVIPFKLVTTQGAQLPSPSGTKKPSAEPGPVVTVPRNESLSGDDFAVPDLGMVMVAVNPAKTLEKFWLGRYEVTQKEWSAIMGENPSDFHGDDLPVDNVSWKDAVEFCRRLNERERATGRLKKGYVYTLPTEAQWDYACRAGTTDAYGGNADDVGWSADNSGAIDPATGIWRMTTHPVGQKQPNAWSFCDMHGNVAEWCLEPYADHPGDAPGLDKTAQPYRILRGGAWWTDVQNCTADNRHKAPADRHHSGLGLRVALSRIAEGH